MFEIKTHAVPDAVRERAHIDNDRYAEMYQRSIDDPDTFWAEQADEFLTWFKKWHRTKAYILIL